VVLSGEGDGDSGLAGSLVLQGFITVVVVNRRLVVLGVPVASVDINCVAAYY